MAAKIIVVLIAVWSVIQGFVYGMLSILALLAHDCQISMKHSRLTYLMYIIFFRDGRCERYIDWNIVANVPPPHEPVWPSVTAVAFRTNVLAKIYLLLSTVWIIASLLLIVGCFMRCFGKATYYFLMMPWVIFCTLTAVFDVVAVAFFFYDLFNTLNMEAFVRHLEMRDTASIYQALQIDANILPMPAVILLLVACRGFLFWCLNILSIPIVLSHCKRIIYAGKGDRDSIDDRDFQYERNNSHDNNVLENHFPPTAQHSRYSDPSHYHRFQYDNISFQQDKYDLGKTIGRRYVEPLKGESIDEPDAANVKRNMASRMSSADDKSSKRSHWSDDSGHTNSTVHLAHQPAHATGPDEPFNWRDMPADRVLRIERPHFRLPSKPSLLKRLSDSSYVASTSESTPVATVPHTSDELRSQLPWSYFGAGANVPRKSLQLREDEELPPVPVPDYTMNLSRTKGGHGQQPNGDRRSAAPPKKFINPKRGTSTEGDSSRWSGPEYRY